MRILAILAVVAGAIWAAKTGKLTELTGRAKSMAGEATGDWTMRAEGAADRVKATAQDLTG
jgi:uncharacterized protein YjbJ (UPF0337 family)